MGMQEPSDDGDLSHYRSASLYYGYYPGVSIVGNAISRIIYFALCQGIVIVLLLGFYPVILLIALILNMRLYVMS